ncbi:class I SAM-dependent methyltransferase [Actinopolymorpha pittospori]|uniref:SAM-dependent methyltransferase n=1 Tax=Actinopolymorpha pittospori TaxID=648752 RepID=A0A927N2Y0_9ACTN|nr:class I SAM-dependent methyltransferase [Actinopolymorpha pittospori]MBE1609328.1 SAM-dependent methyltransferase [Actinopolymorpha pittospori]
MAGDVAPVSVWPATTDEQEDRWAEVLDCLAGTVPPGRVSVVVDGAEGRTRLLADRLAATVRGTGRPCVRLAEDAPATADGWSAEHTAQTVAIADGAHWRAAPPGGRCDLLVWLRPSPGDDLSRGDHGHDADVVVDLQDPNWPVIRHLAPHLAGHDRWYVAENRAFFAARAATWDTKFGDNMPAYAAAVVEADLPYGGVVVDVGCGTGRALPALREAVGSEGSVIGLDLTPQMLAVAKSYGRARQAALVLADARRLPLPDGAADAVFAAGLLMHLPSTETGLAELARVTRSGGRLVLFHPSGRAALAARHGRTLRPDDALAEGPLRRSMAVVGWELETYDDPPERFFAVASRR